MSGRVGSRQWGLVAGLAGGLIAIIIVAVFCFRGADSPSPSSVHSGAGDPCDIESTVATSTLTDEENGGDFDALAEPESVESEERAPEPDAVAASPSSSSAPARTVPDISEQSAPVNDIQDSMIRGILVDIEGKPVEGYVTLEHIPADPNAQASSSFAISRPPSWRAKGLFGCARDVSDALGKRFLWPAGDPNEELVLVMEPYGSVMGRVLGADGQPMSSVRLDLRTQMLDNTWRGGDAALEPAVIDDDGYFLFDRVPVGLKVKVTAHRGMLTGQSRRMQLTPGQTTDAGEIRMRGFPPGEGTIQGRIVDEMGRPLADRSTYVRVERTAQWLTTDAGGYFVIAELPQGRSVTVTIEVDGYGSWSRKAVPDDFNCDFRLYPPGYDIVGKEAPPLFAGTWFNHAPVTLEELRGRVVLLAFRSLAGKADPGLARIRDLQDEFGRRRLLVLAIYNHLPVNSPAAEAIVTDHLLKLFQGAPMAGMLDADPDLVTDLMPPERPAGAGSGASHWMYEVQKPPVFFLIDKRGIVRHCTGQDAELRDWIVTLLDE